MSANLSSPAATDVVLAPRFRITPRLLDRADQVIVVGLWLFLFMRTLRVSFGTFDIAQIAALVSAGHLSLNFGWLAVLSEAVMVAFVLFHRPTEKVSLRLGDWCLAITATAAPLLIQPNQETTAFAAIGLLLFAIGNLVQFTGKMSLRRSFGVAPANRGIKTNGLYRFVRHPIYAGYLVLHIGLFILIPSAYNLAVYAVAWAAQIMRIKAEEALLSQDPAYVAFKQRTRFRLVPGIY